MRAFIAAAVGVLAVVGVSAGGVTAGMPGAGADAMSASVAPPPCSSAVASAPTLPHVTPTLVTTPGGEPFGVAITQNSRDAFVSEGSGPLAIYSLASGTPTLVRSDSGITASYGLGLSGNGRYLVAANGTTGATVFDVAQAINGHTLATSGLIQILQSHGSGSIEAAVSPDGNFAFVSLEDSNDLAIFKLTHVVNRGLQVSVLVGTVPLGEAPVGIAVSPSGHYLYVTSEVAKGSSPQSEEGTLTTINLATAERHPARAIVSTVPAGCNPVRVVATKSSVFVTARASDAVLEFSAQDLVSDPTTALQDDVSVGEAPVGLALADHDRTLVIADSNRFGAAGASAGLAVVTVAAGGQMALAGYVPSGMFPRDMAVSPNGKVVLVCNFDSSQLEAIATAQLP